MLLRKCDKPEGVPSSYRPICLLNDAGKLLESLFMRKLEDFITSSGGLSPNHFGFRKKMSTNDAIRWMHNNIVQEVNRGKFFLAIGIDIKNAFNSIKWKHILAVLERWDVPPYLFRIFLRISPPDLELHQLRWCKNKYNTQGSTKKDLYG